LNQNPRSNVQLSLYALLVAREEASVEEVTCQILSPFYDFEPVVFASGIPGVLLAFGSYSEAGLGEKERHLDHASKRAVQEIYRRAISGETQRANFSPSQSPTAKLESRNADRIPFSAS
jgi:hypothetical protein